MDPVDRQAAPPPMQPGEAVTCRVCRRSIGLTRWGRVARHINDGTGETCSGSGRLPRKRVRDV